VAHRSGVLAISDRLALLKDGTIELFGPRDEVVARLNELAAPRRPRVVEAKAKEGEGA
jgi:ABC-type protease/lipase transport system fused ATPase/permease subunit